MVNADIRTRNINSFQDVAIPSSKDLYRKYGKRIGNGQFAYDSNGGMPVCTSQAVIAQMQSAEKQVEYEARKIAEKQKNE